MPFVIRPTSTLRNVLRRSSRTLDISVIKLVYSSSLICPVSGFRRSFGSSQMYLCDSAKSPPGKGLIDRVADKEFPEKTMPKPKYDEIYRTRYQDPVSRTFGVMADDVKEYFGIKKRTARRVLGTLSNATYAKETFKDFRDEQVKATWPSYCDVVIIGGGAVGSSVAYHLKERALTGLHVVVIEQDFSHGQRYTPGYTRASTTLSVGGIRQQFSIPENIELSMYGMQFLRNAPKLLAVEGADVPDMQFNPGGYLTLASEAGVESLKANYDIQRSVGAKVEMLGASKLKSRFPWINTEGIAAGVIGLENEGWFDPWSLLTSLRRKAISLGADYVNGKVTGMNSSAVDDMITEGQGHFVMQNVKSVEVTLPDGEKRDINTSIVIVAGGAWSGEIGSLLGIGKGSGLMGVPIPIEPRKRYVYCIHAPDGPGLDCPLVIDPDHTYFRREGLGGLYLCGQSPQEHEEPSTENLNVDESFFENKVWPTIAHRTPAFENAKLQSSWAGYYDYNTFDQNGIIGLHPVFTNMFIAAGFSGHGIQQSPGVGRAIMECLLYGEFRTINLERFAFDRVLMQEPLLERYIV